MLNTNEYKDAVYTWLASALGLPVYWILRPENVAPPFVVVDTPAVERTLLSGGWRADVSVTVRYYGRVGTDDESTGPVLLDRLRESRIMGGVLEVVRRDFAPTASPDVFGELVEARHVITGASN